MVAITGASGSGKTSLIRWLAGLLAPAGGSIILDGVRLWDLDERARTRFRRKSLGLATQQAGLVGELTIAENVALPLRLLGEDRRSGREKARQALDSVGIAGLADRFPGEISGGERQRAAIVRAAIHDPLILLADEPTGALDEENSSLARDILRAHARGREAAVVVVTHDPILVAGADRCLLMRHGQLHERAPQ